LRLCSTAGRGARRRALPHLGVVARIPLAIAAHDGDEVPVMRLHAPVHDAGDEEVDVPAEWQRKRAHERVLVLVSRARTVHCAWHLDDDAVRHVRDRAVPKPQDVALQGLRERALRTTADAVDDEVARLREGLSESRLQRGQLLDEQAEELGDVLLLPLRVWAEDGVDARCQARVDHPRLCTDHLVQVADERDQNWVVRGSRLATNQLADARGEKRLQKSVQIASLGPVAQACASTRRARWVGAR